MKIPKKVILLLKISVALSLIIFLIKRLNMNEVISIIMQINTKYLFLGAFCFLMILTLQAHRWQCLLSIHGIKVSLGKTIRLTFIGFFFNNVFPSTVGGDVVKGYLVSRDTKKLAESYVSVLMDRLSGIGALFLLAFVIMFFIPVLAVNRRLMFFIWGGFIIIGFLVVLSLSGSKYLSGKLGFLKRIFQKLKIEDKIEKIYNAFSSHKQYKRLLLKTVFLSIIIQLLFIVVNFLVAKGLPLNQQISPIYFLIYTPTIALISALPISLNGIGIRENLYVQFFSWLLGKDAAGTLSIILLLFLWSAGLVGGLIYLFSYVKTAPIKTLAKKGGIKL